MNKVKANVYKGIVLLSLSFSFMFFLYAPLEVFLGNTNEFWFDILHLLPIVSIAFVVSAVVLILIQILLFKVVYPKKKWVFYAIYTVLLLIFVGFYIQGNYIPRNYGSLDGREIDWSSYTGYAVASIALWLVVVAAGVFLWVKYRSQIFRIGQIVSVVIVIMLTVGLVSLLPSAGQLVDNESIVVTDKDKWTLSDQKNIYVLLLDTFDANFFRQLLEEDEAHYAEVFEDFTFYTNSVGGYPNTLPGVSMILTGEWFNNDVPFEDYLSDAYSRKMELYEELRNNNYSIGMYTTNEFLTTRENTYDNVFSGRYEIRDPMAFAKKMYKLIAFEYMPHQLKSYFHVNTSDFDSDRMLDNVGYAVDSWNEELYYKTLCERGFDIVDDKNAFRFVCLDGLHMPYEFGEDVVYDGAEYTVNDVLMGNMTVISKLLETLKAQNVYDNSAIMILADHGSEEFPERKRANPLLLVKGFGEHHEFAISDNAVSWEDIYPTMLSLVTGEDNPSAVWNRTDPNRERRYLHYVWDGAFGKIPVMTEYSVVGNIADEATPLLPTGRQFVSALAETNEVDGLLLPSLIGNSMEIFEADNAIRVPIEKRNDNFKMAYVGGLGKIQQRADGTKYAWSSGYYTHFKLNPEGKHELPYSFTLYYDELYNPDNLEISNVQNMGIYAMINGERVTSYFTENSMTFKIPIEALNNETVDIRIFYPHAKPMDGNKEENALAITSFEVKPVLPIVVKEQTVIDFTAEGNFKDIYSYGWDGQESNGVWAKASSSFLFIAPNDNDYVMSVNYWKLADVPTVIKVNGHDVCTLSSENSDAIVLPKEYLNDLIQTIEFSTPEAMSPIEAGVNNDDTRILSVFVDKIIITESNHPHEEPVDESAEENKSTIEADSVTPLLPIEVKGATVIDFTAEGNFKDIYSYGWDDQEPSGVWAKENSGFQFIAQGESDYVMSVSYWPLVPDLPTVIKLNGREVCTLSSENSDAIVLPKEYLNDLIQTIEFFTSGAMSPIEARVNEHDARILSVLVDSIVIMKSEH